MPRERRCQTRGVTAVSSRVLTVPNALSLLRLVLIPVFLVLLIAEQYL